MTKQDIRKLQAAIATIREVAATASQSTVQVVALNHAGSFYFLADQLENQASRMWAAEVEGNREVVIRDVDVSEYFRENEHEESGK